ncbi:MAG: phage tail tape measure protein [Taibaiella sp.]|nr:phage tail tape measure protein [Taibaiella sp.]
MSKPNIIPSIFTAKDLYTATVNKMTAATARLGTVSDSTLARMERSFTRTSSKALEVGKTTGALGLAIMTPIGLAVREAVSFEDSLADIAKTTGLAGAELERFGEDILAVSTKTRSSIDDLLQIGEIGGQLGIAKEELVAFTKAADQFNIALGKDYGGGVEEAITSVGKLNNLFKDTRKLNISESITRAGSVINELGAVGKATSQNINDFLLRMGAAPDVMRPAITDAAALAALLEEQGVNSERGGTAFVAFLSDAAKSLPAFAAQMKLTTAEAERLLSLDPVTFAQKFEKAIGGMGPQQQETLLKSLGIADTYEKAVLNILGDEKRLAELRQISNKAFKEGTSLAAEAAKKNATAAAQYQMLKNNVRALGIELGNTLLPALNSVLGLFTSVIKPVTKFAKEHKTLTGIILKGATAAGVLALGISAVSFGIAGLGKVMMVARGAMVAWNFVMGYAAAQTGALALQGGLLNISMAAVPGYAAGATFSIKALGLAAAQTVLQLAPLFAIWEAWNKSEEWNKKTPLQKEIERGKASLSYLTFGDNNRPTPEINFLKSRGFSDSQIDSAAAAGFMMSDLPIYELLSKKKRDSTMQYSLPMLTIDSLMPKGVDSLGDRHSSIMKTQVDFNAMKYGGGGNGRPEKLDININNGSGMDVTAKGTSAMAVKIKTINTFTGEWGSWGGKTAVG